MPRLQLDNGLGWLEVLVIVLRACKSIRHDASMNTERAQVIWIGPRRALPFVCHFHGAAVHQASPSQEVRHPHDLVEIGVDARVVVGCEWPEPPADCYEAMRKSRWDMLHFRRLVWN